MVGAQTQFGPATKIITGEAWEYLGPFGRGRVTMIVATAGLLLQLDGTNALAAGAPLGNRRRMRVISQTLPTATPALQGNLGFDNTVTAAIGWPIWNNGLPTEWLADASVPIWLFAIVAGTFAFHEEATG